MEKKVLTLDDVRRLEEALRPKTVAEPAVCWRQVVAAMNTEKGS